MTEWRRQGVSRDQKAFHERSSKRLLGLWKSCLTCLKALTTHIARVDENRNAVTRGLQSSWLSTEVLELV